MPRAKRPKCSKRLKRILVHYDVGEWYKGCPPGVGDRSMDEAVANGWIVGRNDPDRKRPRAWMLTQKGLDFLTLIDPPRH